MNVGNNIVKLRKKKNLTQEELAKLINVSSKTISSYENNRNLPNIETLINLSEVLEVPVDTILNITKENTNDIKSKYKKQNLIKLIGLLIISIVPILGFSWSSRIALGYVGAEYQNIGVLSLETFQTADFLINVFTIRYIAFILVCLLAYYLYKKGNYKTLLIISIISLFLFVSCFIPNIVDDLSEVVLLGILGITTLIASLKGLLKK